MLNKQYSYLWREKGIMKNNFENLTSGFHEDSKKKSSKILMYHMIISKKIAAIIQYFKVSIG